MKKKLLVLIMVCAMLTPLVLTGCESKGKETPSAAPAAKEEATTAAAEAATSAAEKDDDKEAGKAVEAEKPGESGFLEIPIGEGQIVGPFQVEMVYFQGVDMVPEGRQPSAAESDMHLEADIHLTPEAAKQYGFGAGEDIWPAYLTVDYKVLDENGKEVTSGNFMPMNADDGPHYGINIKKGEVKVGKYKIQLEITPSDDYLLHVDPETGIPIASSDGKSAAEKFYEKQTVEFEWNYDGSQLELK